MAKKSKTVSPFEGIVAGLKEVVDHVEGKDVPGLVIHTPDDIRAMADRQKADQDGVT